MSSVTIAPAVIVGGLLGAWINNTWGTGTGRFSYGFVYGALQATSAVIIHDRVNSLKKEDEMMERAFLMADRAGIWGMERVFIAVEVALRVLAVYAVNSAVKRYFDYTPSPSLKRACGVMTALSIIIQIGAMNTRMRRW